MNRFLRTFNNSWTVFFPRILKLWSLNKAFLCLYSWVWPPPPPPNMINLVFWELWLLSLSYATRHLNPRTCSVWFWNLIWLGKDICNETRPCSYFKVTEQDTVAKISEVRQGEGCLCAQMLSRLSRKWSISPWGCQTLRRQPEGKVEERKAKGGGGGVQRRHWGFRWQVFCGFVLGQTESHKGECPLECSGKFPDPEECCITPSNCSLPARPRTETPFREAAENVGFSHPPKNCSNCRVKS